MIGMVAADKARGVPSEIIRNKARLPQNELSGAICILILSERNLSYAPLEQTLHDKFSVPFHGKVLSVLAVAAFPAMASTNSREIGHAPYTCRSSRRKLPATSTPLKSAGSGFWRWRAEQLAKRFRGSFKLRDQRCRRRSVFAGDVHAELQLLSRIRADTEHNLLRALQVPAHRPSRPPAARPFPCSAPAGISAHTGSFGTASATCPIHSSPGTPRNRRDRSPSPSHPRFNR